MKNCIIGQSGGPTSVINSSVLGVIKEAKRHQEIKEIYGSLNGIEGILNQNFIDLRKEDEKELELLTNTPSAILGSVRYCLSNDFSNKEYETIINTFKKFDIGYFFYVGGNDSMDTVDKLSKYFKQIHFDCKVIGIPKTIDNDLVVTDHSPGYGSAIKYVANTISQIKQDTSCYRKGRVTIVEMMGRDAGWITAGSKLASINGNGPDLIYLPEVLFDESKFLKDIENIYKKNNKVLVCISEGIKNLKGIHVASESAYVSNNDVFGHQQLGGAATVLTYIVKNNLNLPVRAIELNLMQRCASNIASKTDINEAIKCGQYAVKKAILGQTGKMVVMIRNKNASKYQIRYSLVNVDKIANKVKYFPSNWIMNGNDISEDYIQYALPLILGENKSQFENGLACFAKLNKEIVKLND